MRKVWILAPVMHAGIKMFLTSDLFACGDQGRKRQGKNWQKPASEQTCKSYRTQYRKSRIGGYGLMSP